MAAKKRVARRKARKPKIYNIDGHQLTEAMHADYLRCVVSRVSTNHGATLAKIEDLGLDDFLSRYRPSRKIEVQLMEITQEAVKTSLAIGTLRDYSWYQTHPSAIRTGGCDLVKKLALDLCNTSAKLTALVMNVEAEETTKLQDWLAQDEQLARIGSRPEVAAHGA